MEISTKELQKVQMALYDRAEDFAQECSDYEAQTEDEWGQGDKCYFPGFGDALSKGLEIIEAIQKGEPIRVTC